MRRCSPLVVVPFVLAVLLAACATTGAGKGGPPHEDTVRHLPEPFPDTWLGMPYADWRRAHPDARDEGESFDFRIVVSQKAPVSGVAEVTWYFDVDQPGQPLYEAIVDYGSGVVGTDRAIARYGEPNRGDEWQWATAMGWPVRVWAFQSKVVIAAGMPGTEWDGQW